MKDIKDRIIEKQGALRKTDRELMELHYRFLTDRRIITNINNIASIYLIAVPKAIIKENGQAKIIYDEKVEYEVNRIRNIIANIIESDYAELFKDHVTTRDLNEIDKAEEEKK